MVQTKEKSSEVRRIKTVFSEISARKTTRMNFFINEKVEARITTTDFNETFYLVDLSPFGAGVVTDLLEHEMILDHGETVTFSVVDPSLAFTVNGVVTNVRRIKLQGKDYTRIGLYFVQDSRSTPPLPNIRRGERYDLNELSCITCSMKTPHQSMQIVFFSVVDISKHGMKISTSSRHKFIVPKMLFDLEINVPSFGSFKKKVEVKHISASEKGDQYILGVEFVEKCESFLQAVYDYCLNFSDDMTFEKMKRDGVPLCFDSTSISITFVKCRDDFKEVLRLRHLAYGTDGVIGSSLDDDPEEHGDEFDEYSRILIAKVGKQAVGTGRVIFVGTDLSKSAASQHMTNGNELFEKVKSAGFVEVSKFAVDPRYRDGAVMTRLLGEITRIAILENASYMMCMSLQNMVPFYERMGHKPCGDEMNINGRRVFPLALDMERVIQGKDADYSLWNLIVVPVLRQLLDRGKIKMTKRMRFKLWIGEIVRPILLKKITQRARSRVRPIHEPNLSDHKAEVLTGEEKPR